MRDSKGFTLVEIVMVVALIGIIIAATFFFLQGGLRATDAATENSVERSVAQTAASEIEIALENLAYPGYLYRIEEPILELSDNSIVFYSNISNPNSFDLEDKITITSSDGAISIKDGNGENLITPVQGAEIAFNYVDAYGLETLDPLAVRTINFTITMGSGFQYNGYSSPYNMQLVGLSQEDYNEFFANSDGPGSKWESNKFEEDFEQSGTYIYRDSMEGSLVWAPILEEDFESAASWANNWETWSSESVGRVNRYNEPSEAYEGNYLLRLDCSTNGTYSNNMAIWTVDLSSFIGEDLRLHFYWKESGDELHEQDGVFLPSFSAGDTTIVDEEDFSGFRDGFQKDWTYWTNDYGRIVATDDYSSATGGNYINMDSRRNGSTNYCRIMNVYDLSVYSANTDVWLQYDFTDRGDENSSGDFIGLMSGSIQGNPVAQESLSPQSFPDGSWTTRLLDLDELAPSGYDWSDFRIVFAQQDNYPTISATSNDGISIDNVKVFVASGSEWEFVNRMRQAPNSFSNWTECSIDLDSASSSAGIPFSSDFSIGFGQRDNYAYPTDGIMWDGIEVEKQEWGMVGWSHGVWDPYTVDEWEAVNDPSGAMLGDWYYAVAGTSDYATTPTQAWLEGPELDYTGYATGTRLALAIHHKYNFSSGSGCNIKISDDDGATWNIIAPYYGYYDSSILGLGNEPGWTGTSSGFTTPGSGYQFGVFDVTQYAGKTIRVRFNYGIAPGATAASGWIIDEYRTREEADWPQSYSGTPDWCGFITSPSGMDDPDTTPNGFHWAGNDMLSGWYGGRYWETDHAANTTSFLVSPPVCYSEDAGVGDGIYSYIEFMGCPRINASVGELDLLVSAYTLLAPPSQYELLSHDTYQDGWGLYRYRIDNLPTGTVWTANKTVVFRWALHSGSGTLLGGWNLDDIRCFTTNTWLPNMENGVVLVDSEDDPHNSYFTEGRTVRTSVFRDINSYAPVFTDEQETQARF